ncbi:MAG: UDP-N-acetylmuramoyl-L-alanine--D-glutamate ligase [Armatimonadetes bacterium]|nr:UDP-N-acetylmuramoyl-L-alanine--D-glutamate ligase [Armatimonadota bacterium]
MIRGRYAVMGAGRAGLASAQAIESVGGTAIVFDESDPRPVDWPDVRWNSGIPPDSEKFEAAIVSPGFRRDHPIYGWARQKGIELFGEIELGYRLAQSPIIAVTGSNGKSTVTALTAHMLKAGGLDAIPCGNLAGTDSDRPLPLAAIQVPSDSILVAEVSSFQLESIIDFRPKVSIVTNIGREHLDRHATFEEYAAAKARVFENQREGDLAILSESDREKLPEPKAQTCLTPKDVYKFIGKNIDFEHRNEWSLAGSHNLLNAMQAAVAASFFGAAKQAIEESLVSYPGLPHRMEDLGEIDGVRFVNNSMCTNAAALEASLSALSGPLIAIAGGKEKNDETDAIGRILAQRAQLSLLIGQSAQEIFNSMAQNGGKGKVCDNIAQAFEQAVAASVRGDTVVLAPGCASFGEFTNFEERGDRFKSLVQGLKEQRS